MKTWTDVLDILSVCTIQARCAMDSVAVHKIEAIREYVRTQQLPLLGDPLPPRYDIKYVDPSRFYDPRCNLG